MPVLLVLTTTACVSNKAEKQIVLPPEPQRAELKDPETMQDIATLLNYYEHLVQEWEAWGERVKNIVNKGQVEP